MTIITLKPNKSRCRPFWVVQQFETSAWGHGRFWWLAWLRMRRHYRYEPDRRRAWVIAWVVVVLVGLMIGG